MACLTLACLAHVGLVVAAFQATLWDFALEATQWAIEITSITGGILVLMVIVLFLARPHILHPWLVITFAGSLVAVWTAIIVLSGRNVDNLDVSKVIAMRGEIVAIYEFLSVIAFGISAGFFASSKDASGRAIELGSIVKGVRWERLTSPQDLRQERKMERQVGALQSDAVFRSINKCYE
ncbi:hypothetical protein P154DRAFT_582229 [Amniculicola lignicola CBS 123094]|uniref:MARVEL domain-containing protein n=1 Tax=Amniculicola lignicola CBS 123094 TaxID=1392246 RepID=A0A6A5W8N6_9PLEO|nr:hypothetical protein P154DRAFT_582229 [Amniculicola lignicola CBS 123094]